ncbi:MAG: methylthioribulose 1-phosphate dehydratase [Candidatus Methylomirabilis oxygeniifera]|uniref:Methylthioribulose-1-phosphate dehydratase n=1 Tax=Methylomirabilis oxygeniifera TaxID=671143 RepID=D5MLU4_METO1|nr:MAG: methylthioribulose 1-phosphate dehydratase [Candidatus Methylomirabilis oxyfera]CBE70001.1 Methylthioribulose-1-phosphate dehydratase (MTRu-1-P dehydratase) [Candidatus Methylomirabilis oxyfera]
MMTHQATKQAMTALAEITAGFARRGWFPATSGNLSARVSAPGEPLLLVVSASGRDKEAMTAADFLLVDDSLRPVEPGALCPSAETVVHARIYEATGCGCVLHVHTIWNNLIAELCAPQGEIRLSDLEMLKGLDIWGEAAEIRIPVVENLFKLSALAEAVMERITDPRAPGALIRRHGLYAWGANPFEAKRHVEAFEFMFEYLVRWRSIGADRGPAGKNDREGRPYEPTETGQGSIVGG